mmetsp:Transcript_10021/g.30615  ORF Transcript_10021/g.30615 Transcript_10021/m.30615 type:complete len:299 (-) Transcript_10021:1307-2203(-)
MASLVNAGLIFLVLACVLGSVKGESVELQSAALKVVRVQGREKQPVQNVETSGWQFETLVDRLDLTEKMTITYTFSFKDAEGSPFHPQQVFLRFESEEGSEQIYAAEKRSNDMVAEVDLQTEAKSGKFWRDKVQYRMQVIFGDVRMDAGKVWTVWEDVFFTFSKRIEVQTPGVFDFDISVKKELLPEFAFDQYATNPTAPTPIVLAFCALVIIPFGLYLLLLTKLEVLPPQFPTSSPTAWVFQASLGSVAYILVRFWVDWNLVKTGKALLLVFLVLLPSGYFSLAESASRQVNHENRE